MDFMERVLTDNGGVARLLADTVSVFQQNAISIFHSRAGARRCLNSFFPSPPPSRHLVFSFCQMAASFYQTVWCFGGVPEAIFGFARPWGEFVQGSGGFFQALGERSESFRAFPPFHDGFPTNLRVLPKSFFVFPAAFEAFPDFCRVFAEWLGDFPQAMFAFPQAFRVFPEAFWAFAESTGAFPAANRAFLKSSRDFPESFREHAEWFREREKPRGNPVFS
jgi:hypothetical protein